jgi:hypothetical protein
MEANKKRWWVANVAIYRNIAEYTYGPGHYTDFRCVVVYESLEDAFLQIYEATIELYAGEEDNEGIPFEFEEQKQIFSSRLKNEGCKIEYKNIVPEIVFGRWRYETTIRIQPQCLEANGMRNFDLEKEMLGRLLKQLTN